MNDGTKAKTWICGLAVGLLGLFLGCNGKGSVPDNTHGHFHVSNWVAVHAGPALDNLGSCTGCHEMTALRVGTGAPSCATADCHHKTLPGFALPGSHGARAKIARGATGGGMSSCQLCHGKDFAGGTSGRACATCHAVKAPHPPKPWRIGSTTGSASTHADTDPSNAVVCAQCHFPGSPNNPLGHPGTPAPSGTAPGCFNNTLCHADNTAPHALGPVWRDPTGSAFHGFEAKKDLAYCQSCHGTPGTPRFDGGVARTACSSCHTAAKAHSKPWHQAPVATFPGYVPSHRNAGHRDVACALCHDVVKARSAPDPTAPSCFSESQGGVGCHANGPGQPNHAVPFLDTPHTGTVPAGFDSNCGNCHGMNTPSPLASAPTCVTCHANGSPLTLTNCTSCHAKPPTGSAFPDLAGKHLKHEALPGITGACSVCHAGAESGTLAHYDHANGRPGNDGLRVPPGQVNLQATFRAKAGAASFDPATLTCANISCHGGKPAPSWQNGTIDASSDAGCKSCHTLGTALGAPENNSPYSGTHALHLGASVAALCTDCHAMGAGTAGGANHFRFLATTQMEGPASDTLAPMGNPAYYKPSTQTCGTFTCHGHLHGGTSWQGGPNHAVPYLGAPHTTTTQGGFDLDCKACHAVNGTSPLAAAPLCAACHQGGSPLTLSACASCHAKPPSGTAFPDISGRHAKHESLAGVTGACSTCHESFDSGTREHYDHANGIPGKNALRVPPAPVKAMSAFQARAGAAAFDPATLTCSNVSCHGGARTPSWQNGTLDSTTDAGCRQCHALGTALGVPERNSLFSGTHGLHLGTKVAALCTECHAMSNGTIGASNHFKFLNTPQMEGPASDTVAPMGNPAYYKPSDQTCGTFTCHGRLHGGTSWQGGPNHPVPFLGTPHTGTTQATFDADCKSCHGLSGTVSPIQNAPTCVTCHQAGTPLGLSSCTSCHASPPAGTAFPNVAGKHAKHNALPGVATVCAACHTGSESGTLAHYDHANARPGKDAGRVPPALVTGAATYNAKAGALAFNPSALTCANVSCHGGILAPSWATGAIASGSDSGCVQCHKAGTAQGVPENNSYYSGLHGVHLATGVGAVCSDCHGMANGTPGANNHFRFLGTAPMEGPASDTVMPMGNAAYYTASTQTCGTFTCHGTLHANHPWKGGANHAVPFMGSSHTGINSAAAFTTNCGSCHAQTGATSPMALAPTCTTCHQAGTPTTLVNCASCHAKPPGGIAFPNVAGTHAVHDTFPGVTGNCDACHVGSGTGTRTHYDHANGRVGKNGLRQAPGEVAVSTLYNAKTGASTWNPATLTCANVSCHGGQSTPNWQATTSIAADCARCHARGTAQYNSYNSGEHTRHVVDKGFACTQCHDMTGNSRPGALNHFKALGTPAMEGPASDTISFALGDATGARTYVLSGTRKNCTLSCHGKDHAPLSW